MAVWVDPFTGRPVESDVAPLGGPYPAIPGGAGVYQGDPSDFGAAGMLPYGGGNPLTPQVLPGGGSDIDITFSGGYGFIPERGTLFYKPGDEWRILQSYGDIGSLQAALDAMGLLEGGFIWGAPDAKTAAALKKVLEAANASGWSWDQVLSRGLGAAMQASKGRGGGGGGGGIAAITDDDIRALANQVAQDVLGRNLRTEESDAFIPTFRATLASGTSPQVSAQNIVTNETAPVESRAYGIGTVMDAVAELFGG